MKRWRVYFNRQQDWPMIWCLDQGDISTQIRVHWVKMKGVKLEGATVIEEKPKKRIPNEPVAWFEVHGMLRIKNGVATITGKR
jgi:hypothetical protein